MNKKISKLYEPVRGMINYTKPSYWNWYFPFYHKGEQSLIIFTKSGVYKMFADKPKVQLVRIARRYKKKK